VLKKMEQSAEFGNSWTESSPQSLGLLYEALLKLLHYFYFLNN
jgi:hypothetical protein